MRTYEYQALCPTHGMTTWEGEEALPDGEAYLPCSFELLDRCLKCEDESDKELAEEQAWVNSDEGKAWEAYCWAALEE